MQGGSRGLQVIRTLQRRRRARRVPEGRTKVARRARDESRLD